MKGARFLYRGILMEQTKQDNLIFFLLFIYIFWLSLVLTFAVHYFDTNFDAMFQAKTAIYFVIGLIIAVFAPAMFLLNLHTSFLENQKKNRR